MEETNIENVSRPKSDVILGIKKLVIFLIVLILYYQLLSRIHYMAFGTGEHITQLYVISLCAIFFLKSKNIVIWVIKLYQLIAPIKVRSSCRFIPSCSEYTILAIHKYGLFKGIQKGLKRIRNCHIPNGGYDYP